MSPSTVEETLVSWTPRAAAMLARPAGQAGGDAVQQVLDRRRAVVLTDQHRRVVRDDDSLCLCCISCIAP